MALKIGFRKAIVAMVDKKTDQIIKGKDGLSEDGLFTIDAQSSLGVISGAITGLAPTQNKVYGSDVIVDVTGKGSGAVSLTLAVNDLPDEILNKLGGLTQDEKTGAWFIDSNTKPPFAAIDLVSTNGDGQPIHFALYKGKFGPEEVSLNTNQDQENRATDSITFSAVYRNTDSRIYGKYTQDATHTEADILKDIFLDSTSGN